MMRIDTCRMMQQEDGVPGRENLVERDDAGIFAICDTIRILQQKKGSLEVLRTPY